MGKTKIKNSRFKVVKVKSAYLPNTITYAVKFKSSNNFKEVAMGERAEFRTEAEAKNYVKATNKIIDSETVKENLKEPFNNNNQYLMVRKPYSFEDVKAAIDRKISPAEEAEIVENKEVKRLFVKNWDMLETHNLSGNQFYKVFLKDEKATVLVDTQGFNYPRYAGILER